MQIFAQAQTLGGEARIVGGAVRDWLAGYPVGDIDMAINLPIETVASHMMACDMCVAETGMKHGTITLYDNDDQIELTQTRVDLETDGRHAIVAHDQDWVRDATRRDFTINALYLDSSGGIFDPLDGKADLQAGRLLFAGDAGLRVQEDALRIIRYCRFLPRFAATGIDPQAQTALRKHASKCAGLSGERIANEMRRIMVGGRLKDVIGLMQDTKIDQAALGLSFDPSRLANDDEIASMISGLSANVNFAWLVNLAVAMPSGSAALLAKRLRLSRAEERCLTRLDLGLGDDDMTMLSGARWRQVAYYLGDMAALLFAVQSWRNGHALDESRLAEFTSWTPPQNPICGADLLSHGVDNGPGLGHMLKQAETKWVESDFTLKKSALLEWLLGN
jgi:tRNA nucleotidyltransferase/poly(A) polymerase